MTGGRGRRAGVGLGLAFGAVCFVLFARNAHWEEIGAVLADADGPTMLLAAGFLLMTSVARAWRWRYLLRDVPVSFRHRLTSTFIGFAGNNVLPGRLGEPLRCWALSRLSGRVGFWQAAGSIVIERVFDLAAAVGLLVLFLVLAPFPPDAAIRDAAFLDRLREEGAVVGGLVLLALVLLGAFASRRLEGGAWYARLAGILGALQKGFAGLRSARAIAAAAGFTVVLWTSMVLFELVMLRAFGFTELGWEHAVGLLVVLSFAVALPQAPAGVGVVQVATETTLTALYGLPPAHAKAFAIGLWAYQVVIVVGAGAVALWFEGLSLADVRRARSVIEAMPNGASPE